MSVEFTNKIHLGQKVTHGAWSVAGVAALAMDAYVSAQATAVSGRLVPVAVMIEGPGGRQAFAPSGEVLDEAALEALLPGAWEAFAAQTPVQAPHA
ncbi:hypothetical protein LCM17_02945 [Cereibacter sphaeroides]|nr:hypothetical protein [Cereibacter sphaeroides]